MRCEQTLRKRSNSLPCSTWKSPLRTLHPTGTPHRTSSLDLSLETRSRILDSTIQGIATSVHFQIRMPETELSFLVYSFTFSAALMASSTTQSTQSETCSSFATPRPHLILNSPSPCNCLPPKHLSGHPRAAVALYCLREKLPGPPHCGQTQS